MPADLPGWLSYLERLHPKSIELGLGRISEVRDRMQLRPEFPIITVAGTNGKGSTCAMLESILTGAGYRVGCYTSPHLLRYNERLHVDCREIDDRQLCRAFEMVEIARGDVPLTYFEFGTLAAMLHFIESSVDVAVMEIGLGGRLDAVNAFEPSCAVITSIDLDHLDYLGSNRESIGLEKAGVYRTAVPAVCGDPDPPLSVMETASRVAADLRRIGRDFGFENTGHGWNFWSRQGGVDGLPLPSLTGSFQLGNAACALEALMSLDGVLPVSDDRMRAGLSSVKLSGRFQKVSADPCIILDVAHNPHAAAALAGNLRQSSHSGRTLAVFAMLADKDIAGVVRVMAPAIDAWFLAGIDQPRGLPVAQLAEIVGDSVQGAPVASSGSVAGALADACRSAGENDRIVAFGSFYTVADVLCALPTTD